MAIPRWYLFEQLSTALWIPGRIPVIVLERSAALHGYYSYNS
jgi:hypothetical protein